MTVQGNAPVDGVSASATQGPANAAATGKSAGVNPGEKIDGKTTLSSMEELKKKSPELYNLITVEMAYGMIKEQEKSNERFHKLMKEDEKRRGG